MRDFPRGPAVKTPCFHCRGHELIPSMKKNFFFLEQVWSTGCMSEAQWGYTSQHVSWGGWLTLSAFAHGCCLFPAQPFLGPSPGVCPSWLPTLSRPHSLWGFVFTAPCSLPEARGCFFFFFFFFKTFLIWTIFKVFIEFGQSCFCFMFWFCGPEACGILAP